MRFAFTDDQLAFADAVRDLLGKECPPATVRAAWDSATGRSGTLWAQLAEMGVLGMLAPEGTGGMGLAEIDLVQILFEAGRAALPEPLAATAVVAVPAIRDHAPSDDAERWLEAICGGEATVAVQLSPNTHAVGADSARLLLLEAPDGLHLVEPDVVELIALPSVDGSRRLSQVIWHPSAATLLSGGAAAVAQARSRAAVATAAELCGLSDTMIAMTVAYCSERTQFGVPIGSFQAIKHQLADALLAVEFAKPLVWRAAQSLSVGDADAAIHSSMAKAAATDAADVVGRAALQCHGAIGYTVECDLHLWLKRSWALRAQDGDAPSHRRAIARQLLGEPAG